MRPLEPIMATFQDMVCYQEEVRDPSRMAEVLNRVIEKAIRGSAPAQMNIPRDYWTQVIDIEIPPINIVDDALEQVLDLSDNTYYYLTLDGISDYEWDSGFTCTNMVCERSDNNNRIKNSSL